MTHAYGPGVFPPDRASVIALMESARAMNPPIEQTPYAKAALKERELKQQKKAAAAALLAARKANDNASISTNSSFASTVGRIKEKFHIKRSSESERPPSVKLHAALK